MESEISNNMFLVLGARISREADQYAAISNTLGGVVMGVAGSLVVLRWGWGVMVMRVVMLLACSGQLAVLILWRRRLRRQKRALLTQLESKLERLP